LVLASSQNSPGSVAADLNPEIKKIMMLVYLSGFLKMKVILKHAYEEYLIPMEQSFRSLLTLGFPSWN
jgi:hypothetical protein